MASNKLKDFFNLQSVQTLVNNNCFDELYQLFEKTFPGNSDDPHIWDLTQILLGAKVDFLEHMKEIPNYCFYSTNIEVLVIPANIKKIGDCAFMNCTKLLEVYIKPKANLKIGHSILYGCNNLQGIYADGDISKWYQIKFDKYWSLGVKSKTPVFCNNNNIIFL
jgi:hypothetical protein